MKENSKDRSVTIRINKDVYQRLVDETLERSVKEGKLIKISEIIREKLIKNLSQELPYITHVEILKIDQTKSLSKIYANIWVEKIGQKKIIIGKNGEKLKLIGTQARLGLEKFLSKKV